MYCIYLKNPRIIGLTLFKTALFNGQLYLLNEKAGGRQCWDWSPLHLSKITKDPDFSIFLFLPPQQVAFSFSVMSLGDCKMAAVASSNAPSPEHPKFEVPGRSGVHLSLKHGEPHSQNPPLYVSLAKIGSRGWHFLQRRLGG